MQARGDHDAAVHERTRLLRRAADRRSLALAAAHFGVVAVVLACHTAGYPVWFAVPVLAASAFVQLIAVHNAMHTPVFVAKRLNRVWQCLLSMCIGYPVSVYVPVHNLSHHLGLQTAKDVLRTTEVRHRSNLLNLLHHMAMGTVHLHLLHVAYLGTMRKSRPKWYAQVRWELLAVLAYFAVVAFLVGPLAVLGLLLLPSVTDQLLMVGFGYVQHDGCDADSEYNHSRNFLGGVFNWFICDNGYHTAHHNRAAVHWSRGRAAHLNEVVLHMDPALDEPSLVRYLWRTFIWPGRRLRFDGQPVQLPPQRERRELWTPASAITSGASSGAVEG